MEERRDQPQWLAGPIGRVKKKKGGREGGLRGESREGYRERGQELPKRQAGPVAKKRGSTITGRPTRSSQLFKQKLRRDKDERKPGSKQTCCCVK